MVYKVIKVTKVCEKRERVGKVKCKESKQGREWGVKSK